MLKVSDEIILHTLATVEIYLDTQDKMVISFNCKILSKLCELYGTFIFNKFYESFAKSVLSLEEIVEPSKFDLKLIYLESLYSGLGSDLSTVVEEDLIRNLIHYLDNKHTTAAENFSIVNSIYSLLNSILSFVSVELFMKIKDIFIPIYIDHLSSHLTNLRYLSTVSISIYLIRLIESTTEIPLAVSESILPRICFNRYYPIEGIKSKSQQIWMDFTKSEGRKIMIDNLASYVEYYLSYEKDNHISTQECLCYCLNEMITKIPYNLVQEYIKGIVHILIEYYRISYYIIKEIACLALCTIFILL